MENAAWVHTYSCGCRVLRFKAGGPKGYCDDHPGEGWVRADALVTRADAESRIGWRSIETAPNLGWVELRCPSGYTNSPYAVVLARRAEGGWRDHAGDLIRDAYEAPTHWRPATE